MKNSKLRRTLAVFLSMAMLLICMPLTGITASAATIKAEDITNGKTIAPGDIIKTQIGTTTPRDLAVYFIWKGESTENISYSDCVCDRGIISITICNSYPEICTNSKWTAVKLKDCNFGSYEVWLASDAYKITLSANGGSLASASPSYVTTNENGKLSSLPAEPTRTGYEFLGWYDRTTGGNKITTSTVFTANKTIYAQWKHAPTGWNYTASGNVITAKCADTGCYYSTHGYKLTLNADNAEYSENTPYSGASVSADSGFPVSVTTGDIKYTGTGTTDYPESADAPTEIGTYQASVTVGGATAVKAFEIEGQTMAGVTAANVTATYDGETSHGITVTGAPEGAKIYYGVSSSDISQETCTVENNLKYIDANIYTVYYKVVCEKYKDFIGSATVTINKAVYNGTKTATGEILAGEALTNIAVTLPATPDFMSYGSTCTFSPPVTAASVSDGVLTFSTNTSAADGISYTITVPVNGDTGANYNNYTVTVTLRAKTCPHTTHETGWTSDSTGHWHKCPDCPAKVGFTAHNPKAAVQENVVPVTCTTDGTHDEVVYCDDCEYEISRTPRTVTALTHSFTNYVSDNNATCTTDCTETAVCDREGCDETDTKDITGTKLGHSWSSEWTTNETHHWHECENGARCPNTANDTKNEYAEHSFGEWTITTQPQKNADGEKKRTCSVCSYEQKAAVKYVPDTNDTSTGNVGVLNISNANESKIDISKNDIVDKITLTDEERKKIENGTNVNVTLEVVDINGSIPTDDRQKIDDTAAAKGYTVAQYLDIKLWKVIGDDFSTPNKTQVTETTAPVKIVFTMPDVYLIGAGSELDREYKIIRVHGTEVKIIDGTFDKATKQFSFMSDKFSSYGIIYTDKVGKPEFSHADGTQFTSSLSVTLTSSTPGADIYYTTNGATPTAASTKYTGPITIYSSTIFKAIAIKSGQPNSDVVSVTYNRLSGGGGGGGYVPSRPTEPSEPSEPTDPSEPSDPTDPSEPSDPTDPSKPSDPTDPSEPSDPTDPSKPSDPTDPSKPSDPTDPSKPSDPNNPTGGNSGTGNSGTGESGNPNGSGEGSGAGSGNNPATGNTINLIPLFAAAFTMFATRRRKK